MVKGEASGKTVFVDSMGDVFVFPLKMLGFSANSVDKDQLDEARDDPAGGRAAPSGPRLQRVRLRRWTDEAVLTLGWTGPLGQELKDEHDKGEALATRADPRARSSGSTPG